jgi:hypothetical protein
MSSFAPAGISGARIGGPILISFAGTSLENLLRAREAAMTNSVFEITWF